MVYVPAQSYPHSVNIALNFLLRYKIFDFNRWLWLFSSSKPGQDEYVYVEIQETDQLVEPQIFGQGTIITVKFYNLIVF